MNLMTRPKSMARTLSCLEQIRKKYAFPGATVAWKRPGKPPHVLAIGEADLELHRAMEPDARMLAASIGKTFVAAACLSLAQTGAVVLDRPIAQHLDHFPWFHRLPNAPLISLRHLLQHSGGLADHVHDPRFLCEYSRSDCMQRPPFSVEHMIGFILDRPPLFTPGTGWSYSDTGYLLVGLLIEQVIQKPWTSLVKQRFLDPLRLVHTTPSDRRDLWGLVPGYTPANNPFGIPEKSLGSDGRMVWHPGIEGAGGGFASNASDLACWGALLYEGEAMQGEYLKELFQSVPVGTSKAYGAGVVISEHPQFGTVYGHNGLIPGYTSCLRYYARQQTAIAFQLNTDVGIADHTTDLFETLEEGLAKNILATTSLLKKELDGY